MAACLLLVAGLLFSTSAANQIYEWTDKEGVKHFSDSPPVTEETVKVTKEIPLSNDIPPAVKSNVTKPTVPEEDPPEALIEEAPASLEYTVELFSTEWCKYCKMARNFLIENNIPFKEYDIEKDKSAAERKIKLAGRSGVPYALINGKGIYGFSKQTYARALGLE